MKKEYIIKKNYHISEIISKKKSVANKYFIVYKQCNNIGHFRYVVSIGKKVGIAVTRNKIKRQIKTIIYDKRHDIFEKYDILIIVRPNVNQLTFKLIEKHLLDALKKAKLI